MHIDLTPENRAKVLPACGKLNMSANQVVNLYLSAVDLEELTQLVTLKLTMDPASLPEGLPQVQRKKIRIVLGG